MTLQWVTQLHIYLQTQVSKTYKFGLFLQQVSGYKHQKQSYPSFVLYISNVSFHFISVGSVHFCEYKRLFCFMHYHTCWLSFKGIVHPKMTILSLISYSCSWVKTFVHLWNTNDDIFDEIWVSDPPIDSKATDTFKARKALKFIYSTFHTQW